MSQRRLLIAVAKEMLDGVGSLPSVVEQYELGFHYRRSLSAEEISLLSPEWCAIPATDPGGRGKVIERNT